ncbi:hypothetical protein FA95DRAFT_1497272 [Auriscalpium vulgare]|uniref:Uncharacterized protein n=1 Tax=Auriscalpium vulgare TaxID=40419 RepID=A0ACB8RKP7_9AGAM|nr:hypothetical protein FA95DRAFT_1497272 [Auriscalpium vulgare]
MDAHDIEKVPPREADANEEDVDSLSAGSQPQQSRFQRFSQLLRRWGVETHGIAPIPLEDRTDKRLYQMFFAWLSVNLNVLPMSTGSAGPAFFSLGLKDSLIIILFVDLVTCAVPAFFGVFGPKLGTRAMVQARFSWGLYGAMIPSLLNVFSLMGFLILNTIVGGQTLASVSTHLNDTVGIVIIAVISLVVSFMGYRILHLYESFAWFPNFVAFITMLGAGAKHVVNLPTPPPTPSAVLSFASIVFSSVLSWCTMTPDYGVYHAPAPSWRIFIYVYLGFFIATLPGHMLGAVFAAGAPAVPAWQAGLGDNGSNIGGLIGSVLGMAGGFGKFMTVVIALTIPSAVAPTMYSFGTSFMAVTPFLAKIPRYVYAVISTAILIPIAIVGAVKFYNTLIDILSIIGYWSSSFAAIVLVEHAVIRRGRWATYATADWATARRLPLGLAAVLAFCGSIALIVPSMDQVWYAGPIAKSGTGDIAMFTGFASAALLYVPLRLLERWWEGRLGWLEREAY